MLFNLKTTIIAVAASLAAHTALRAQRSQASTTSGGYLDAQLSDNLNLKARAVQVQVQAANATSTSCNICAEDLPVRVLCFRGF